MNRLWSAALVLFLIPGVAAAQAPDQEQMKKNLDEKLAKPFVQNATWILDYDEAKAASKKSGKPILAYFTRSYAN